MLRKDKPEILIVTKELSDFYKKDYFKLLLSGNTKTASILGVPIIFVIQGLAFRTLPTSVNLPMAPGINNMIFGWPRSGLTSYVF